MSVRLLVLTVVAVVAAGALTASAPFSRDLISLDELRDCSRQTDDTTIACKQRAVRTLLRSMTARELMTRVENEFPPGECHAIGHVIGQETNASTFESAMLACGGTCNFACVHGAIGHAFSEMPDIKTMEAEGGVNSATIQTEGAALCDEGQSCHGVGHMLFLFLPGLTDALEMCDEISPDSERAWSCYSGVFMENGVLRVSANVALDPARARESVRDPHDLLAPCPTLSPRFRGACYHFLYLNQDVTLHERGITTWSGKYGARADACLTLDDRRERGMCFEGIGMSLFVPVPVSREDAVHACESVPDPDARAGCAAGFSHALTIFDRGAEAVHFCASLTEAYTKQNCYEGIFWPARAWSLYSPETLCALTEDGDCTRFLASYTGRRPFFFE
jgi:hypothetical protein